MRIPLCREERRGVPVQGGSHAGLVYPSVSGVGVYVPTLEDQVVVETCVVGADDRSDGYRCVVVAAWYPRARGGRGVEEAGNIE